MSTAAVAPAPALSVAPRRPCRKKPPDELPRRLLSTYILDDTRARVTAAAAAAGISKSEWVERAIRQALDAA